MISYQTLSEIYRAPFEYIDELDVIIDSYGNTRNKEEFTAIDIANLMFIYRIVIKMDNKRLLLKIENVIDTLLDIILRSDVRDIRNFKLNDLISPVARGVFDS